jgi:hypothetical protein
MKLEGQKPPRAQEYLRWTILRLGFNKRIRGWKAGPNLGFATHCTPFSKPCKDKLTNGGLSCKWCGPEFPLSFTGYCPLIDESGEKLVGLYGRDSEDLISEIQFGAEIEVRKGPSKNSPYKYSHRGWCGHPCPWLGRLKVQHDIGPFLLQLWKDDELKAYFGMTPQGVPVPPTKKPEEREKLPAKTLAQMFSHRTKQVAPLSNGVHHDD